MHVNFKRQSVFTILVITLLLVHTNHAKAQDVKTNQSEQLPAVSIEKLNIKKVMTLAENGNVHAQQYLAGQYQLGFIIPHSLKMAKHWYLKIANTQDDKFASKAKQKLQDIDYILELQKQANNGNAKANYELGNIYFNGELEGNSVGFLNEEVAFDYYLKSAKQGYDVAQNKVADLYIEGYGKSASTKIAETNAVRWYAEATALNNSNAQVSLGKAYENGTFGLKKSSKTAFTLYTEASKLGNSAGQYHLAEYYAQQSKKALTSSSVDKNKLQQSQSKATYWYQQSANNGNADAQLELGKRYYTGYGVEKNTETALEWFEKSSKGFSRSSDIAYYYIGKYFFDRKDYKKAQTYLHDASMNHIPQASVLLGHIDLKNNDTEGAKLNFAMAEDATRGKGLHDPIANYYLGNMSLTGEWGRSKSIQKAYLYYKKAGDFTPAIEALANLSLNERPKLK